MVGCHGASLGRKPTNDIVLSISVPVSGACAYVGVGVGVGVDMDASLRV